MLAGNQLDKLFVRGAHRSLVLRANQKFVEKSDDL